MGRTGQSRAPGRPEAPHRVGPRPCTGGAFIQKAKPPGTSGSHGESTSRMAERPARAVTGLCGLALRRKERLCPQQRGPRTQQRCLDLAAKTERLVGGTTGGGSEVAKGSSCGVAPHPSAASPRTPELRKPPRSRAASTEKAGTPQGRCQTPGARGTRAAPVRPHTYAGLGAGLPAHVHDVRRQPAVQQNVQLEHLCRKATGRAAQAAWVSRAGRAKVKSRNELKDRRIPDWNTDSPQQEPTEPTRSRP